MRDLKKEIFQVLLLNSQNHVAETLDISRGTVNASYVEPREVMESALTHNAVSLIFAHNHPPGFPEPSADDKEITRDLVFAAEIMRLKVLDHIIVGDNRYYSFAGEGLISQYETEFLNLKINAKANRMKTPVPDLPWITRLKADTL